MMMTYSDVCAVAESAGLVGDGLWNACPKFQNPTGSSGEFTTDQMVLRRLCQLYPTDVVRRAVGRE